jgi:hypothetical protein
MWWVWRARRDEGGALSPEYVGVVVLVAALVTAILLTNPGVSESVAGGFRNAVCTVIGEGCQVAATDGAPDQPPDGGDTDDGDGSGAPPDGEGEDAPADDGQDEPAPAEEDEGFDIVEIARYFGLELLSMVTGLWDLVTQLASSAWRLATDSDYRNQLLEVGRAILDDPLGFLQTLIAGIIEPLQTALEEGLTNEVIGRTLAQGVLAALGLGGARVTSQLSRVVSRLDNDVLRRAARGDGPELCPVGALPAPYLLAAATPILLAADGDCVDAPDNNNNNDDDDGNPDTGHLPEDLRDPEFVDELGTDIAGHIGGRQLNDVPSGNEAGYIRDLILRPGPTVRSRVTNPSTGETIFWDTETDNIVIYQPLSAEGGTAFGRSSREAAQRYFDDFPNVGG